MNTPQTPPLGPEVEPAEVPPRPAAGGDGGHWGLHRVLGGATAVAGGVLLFAVHHGPGDIGPAAATNLYAAALVLLVGGTLWFACGWCMCGR